MLEFDAATKRFGGAVFALTGDVVIGAGAACYAVARHAWTRWRGTDHHDPTVRGPHGEQDPIAR
jgi:hypothetical protein